VLIVMSAIGLVVDAVRNFMCSMMRIFEDDTINSSRFSCDVDLMKSMPKLSLVKMALHLELDRFRLKPILILTSSFTHDLGLDFLIAFSVSRFTGVRPAATFGGIKLGYMVV